MTKFNETIFSAFEHFSYNENSLEHLLDILNARSSRSIVDKFNHNCIPQNIFTWKKNDETKVLTVAMEKITTGFTFNLDIEENGRMFLSEGKDTMRTPLPAYELNNLSYSTKTFFKGLLNTITCEDCTVQDMFNTFSNHLEYNEAYKELTQKDDGYFLRTLDDDEYVVRTYGYAPHGGSLYQIVTRTSPEYIKDEIKIGAGSFYTLLIGKKEVDKEELRTVRYFNVYYQNKIITNRSFMNEAQEWYAYFDEEQGKWIIPEDEPCYGYREQFEEILNRYADKEGAFFYHSINDEIHCYFDKEHSPKIWLRQYGTDQITDQINFDKTIEFNLEHDFEGHEGFERFKANSQVIEHFEDEYSDEEQPLYKQMGLEHDFDE